MTKVAEAEEGNNANMALRIFRSGIYKHYKGGLYRVLFLVRHHDSGEPMVVYASLDRGTLNVREWPDFIALVEVNGEPMPRFAYQTAGLE